MPTVPTRSPPPSRSPAASTFAPLRSLALFPLLLLPLLPACSDDEPRDATPARRAGQNVLVISIDTLRADHLGCYGYAPYREPVSPAIDQFAEEALVFERCFAPRGQTGPSLASLLTGCFPSTHGVLDNFETLRPELFTLPQCFAAAGYATHAFVAFLPIAKASRAVLGFEQGDPRRGSWLEAKPRMPDAPQSRWDDAAEQGFARFLRARGRDAPPFLAWLHFYDVHQPYGASGPGESFATDYRGPLRLPPGASEAAFDAIVKRHLDERMVAREPLATEDARYVIALYDAGIRATDERIGRVLGELAAAGLDDETIVVLTADHGEELGEHSGYWFHGNSVHDAVLRIPLLVRGPGIAPGRTTDLIQNVDLLPTLLELAGARAPEGIDGVSFAPELRGARRDAVVREVAWSEWEHLILGARTTSWKLIVNPRGARPKKPPYHLPADPGHFVDCFELYHVAVDPGETANLWREREGAGGEAVARLLELANAEYERRFAQLQPGAAETIADPAERERLLGLGYPVGGEPGGDYALDPERCRDR